jgi:hypothetical protein
MNEYAVNPIQTEHYGCQVCTCNLLFNLFMIH